MRQLLAVLLLVASGSSWAYTSTQSWGLTPIGATAEGTGATASTPAGALANVNSAYSGYTWIICGSAPPYTAAVTANTCANPSYSVVLLSSSCAAGDTLDAGGLTCTAAGGGGTTGGGTGGTGYGGDSGTGFAAWLLSWLNAFTAWILTVIASVFVGLWSMLTDLFIFVLDSLFDLVLYIVSGMSWDFTTFNPVTYWNQLPADLVSVLNLIGVPIALGMIVAALGIRFILQLIPFVRWGS